MSKGSKFFLIICIIGALAVAWFVLNRNSNLTTKPKLLEPTASQTIVKKTKTYTSSVYGFSFSYPDNLDIDESSPEHISVGRKGVSIFNSLVDITLIKSSPEIQVQSFEEFVLDQSRLACSYNISSVSQLCTRIDDLVKIKPFTSKTGIYGQVFYLKADEKTIATGKIVSKSRGPFYTFNTSIATPNSMSFILISNPINKDPSNADLPVIEAVANSVLIQGSTSN
jgi:hypothetical protein